MTAFSSTTAAPGFSASNSEQEQAKILWSYLGPKHPRLTEPTVQIVVRKLAQSPLEGPKQLARRLQQELLQFGVAIKHTAAVEAASRLQGFSDWHTARRQVPNDTLRLTVVMADVTEDFARWQDLAIRLCSWCEDWVAQRGPCVFSLSFAASHMAINVHVKQPDASEQTWPFLLVTTLTSNGEWLADASGALERLRRHLEEPGKAILDGLAVFQLCRSLSSGLSHANSTDLTMADVVNSELVLLQVDHELDSGYEIARGDELTCWSQLKLASKKQGVQAITLKDGAWIIGEARYIWQLSTIRPKDISPGLLIQEFNEANSAALLRRYHATSRFFLHGIPHLEVKAKLLKDLGGLSECYRIDVPRLLRELDQAGLTWESYCAEVDEQLPMDSQLPVGFVLGLIERLQLQEPNVLFARPNRSELALAKDDVLLRTLLLRVDHVTYRLPRGVSSEILEKVREAIDELSTGMRLQKLMAGGTFLTQDDPLPYLVYASDAEEFRLTLESHSMVMYVGIVPRLFRTEVLQATLPQAFPFALGQSLFLDIDFAEEAAL
ncbi:glyoxalase superfamily protein [Chromobacterium rhizoryzae]|uniref:glyoxalase superfamily protein n=1 Tax=Chromobacterium rhizoryzae TaxID=1778675 RepID=UPI001D079BBA|nr:glyoxalase superfamily protein [Chromobacterium rhizoryzae]